MGVIYGLDGDSEFLVGEVKTSQRRGKIDLSGEVGECVANGEFGDGDVK